METLAFIYTYVIYEDQHPTPERSGFTHPHCVQIGFAGAALALTLLNMISTSAIAAVRRGDRGSAVTEVQRALINKGHNPGAIDGVFGGQTQYAVIQFQQKRGLPADGVVGPSTAQVLGISNPTPTPTTGGGTSSPATTGSVRVTAPNGVNIRSGPGTSYARVGGLTFGTVVATSSTTNGWYKIADGWISASYTSSASSGTASPSGNNNPGNKSNSGTIQIATNGTPLNVRSGPGTSYAALTTLSNGITIATSGRTSGGWIQLAQGGWVSSQWVIAR